MPRRKSPAHKARRSRAARPLLCLLFAAAALLCSAPAGAVVVSVGSHAAPVGVEPLATAAATTVLADPLDGTSVGVTYHGGPVVHEPTTYALFWDPAGSFHASTEQVISSYFANSAHDSGGDANVFSVGAQYADASGSAAYAQTYGGTFIDTDAYPASACATTTATAAVCLDQSQALSELEAFIATHGLPTGMSDVYALFTPDTVVMCLDGSSRCSTNSFCSLHSYASYGSSTLLYMTIPFTLLDSTSDAKACQEDGNANVQTPSGDSGLADVAIRGLNHEELETITDPLLNAWYDAAGNEVDDICNGISWNPDAFLPVQGGSASAGTLYDQTINGAHYYLQSVWSNEANDCSLATGLTPTISGAPASVQTATPITLSASAGTGAPISSYSWSFGDGQTASGASVSHSYAAAGTYTVTLTATDAYANTGSASEQLVVTNPPASTAGASGSRRSRAVTRCGAARHACNGAQTRHCTITTTTTMDACKRGHRPRCAVVKRTTTRRRSCSYTRPTGTSTWSLGACSASVIVRSSRA